jgi:hypothetical protein
MKKNNLGVIMIITKEFRKGDIGKKKLLNEIMVFVDQTIITDDNTQLQSLLIALENTRIFNLVTRKTILGRQRYLYCLLQIRQNFKNWITLDKCLKGFYN